MFILKSIALGLGVLLTSVAGWLGYQQNLGANVPIAIARFETTLASKVSTTDTSMTLVTGEDQGGNDLNGRVCFTLDGGKTTEEFVCGTASSTAVTAMTRGISYTDPNATSSALIFAHRAGSNVKITDWPQSGITSRILNGDDKIPNVIKYSTDSAAFIIGDDTLTSKSYVDTVALAGAADSYFTTKGLLQLATTTLVGSRSATGTTGAWIIPSNTLFSFVTTSYGIPVATTSGYISQGWLNLTESFAFATLSSSKTLTVTGTSSFIGAVGITGTTTFGAIPTLPSATPTTAYQVASKAYADTFMKFTTTSDIATSRAYNATYQNSSGWRFVSVVVDMPTATYLYAKIGVVSTTMNVVSQILVEGNERNQLSFWIPPNYFYNASSGPTSSGFTLVNWAETY